MTDNKNNKSHKKTFNLPAYLNIPLFLYQDSRLNKDHMLLAGLIYSLHTAGKKIKMSNDYICALLLIKKRQVDYLLCELENFKYIERKGATSCRSILWIYTPESRISIEEYDTSAQPCATVQELDASAQPCGKLAHNRAQELAHNRAYIYQSNNNKDYKRERSTTLVGNPVIDFLEPKFIAQQSQFNLDCLEDKKCNEIFDNRFKGLEVTLEEILFECVMYYVMKTAPMMVSPHRFRQWLKRERIDIYDKKPDSLAHKLWRDLTEEERNLISDYNHFKKYPDIGCMTEAKQKKAQELIDELRQTQNMRVL